MAVFRVEWTRVYTVMSNYHLKDTDLTLKSKGLLSMMLSLPDGWIYPKSAEDKHKLIIDEYAADVVCRIFTMRREGAAYGKIVAALNAEGVLFLRGRWHSLFG